VTKKKSKQTKKEIADTDATGPGATRIGDAVPVNDEGQEKQSTWPVFTRDITWTPHMFDSHEVSYDKLCPNGGPGGLICCSTCTANYSQYLSQTQSDMEAQKTAKAGCEVKEILEFTKTAKSRLAKTIKIMRKKPVPVRRTKKQLKPPPKSLPPAASVPEESHLSFPSTMETFAV